MQLRTWRYPLVWWLVEEEAGDQRARGLPAVLSRLHSSNRLLSGGSQVRILFRATRGSDLCAEG